MKLKSRSEKYKKIKLIILVILIGIFFLLLDFILIKSTMVINSIYNEVDVVNNQNDIDIIANYSNKTGSF
jgi:hypothetical protein